MVSVWGMRHSGVGAKSGDPPDVREGLQKSPLVWERGEAAKRGVRRRELGLQLVLVLVSSCMCTIISEYLQFNIEEMALTVK